jgi:hypothetical protein
LATASPTTNAFAGLRAGSRWWMPSLTDVFFFAVIFTLFLSDPAGWDRLTWDGDTGMHIRIGDYILDHGQVPTTDPFSFTRPGQRWFAYEWLTNVVFALLNRAVGLKGIVLLCGVLIAATFAIVLRNMLVRGANGLVSMLLVLLAGNAMSIHLHARPHVFTLFFLSIAHYLIALDLKRPSRAFWWIVPLTLLWVNMHSGFPVIIATLGLLAAGCGIGAVFLKASWTPVRRYVTALVLCSGATLINPNGLELYRHILQVINNPWVMQHIDEFQPPVFRSEAMYYALAILFAALIAVRPMMDRAQWPEILWVLTFGAGALISARHIPVFLVVATPLVAVEITAWLDRLAKSQGPKSVLAVVRDVGERATARLQPVGVWSAIVVVGIALFSTTFPTDLSGKYFPREMVSRHSSDLAAARVFTTDQWGDYLLWRNYPRQKVFMDGRSDFYQQSLGDEYIAAENALSGWQKILGKYQVSLALVPPDIPLADALRTAPDWQLIDQDKQAMLFRLRGVD